LDSLSGKLNFFYPALYSSLTLWEKEALDNSGWFSRATMVVKGNTEGFSTPMVLLGNLWHLFQMWVSLLIKLPLL
jgi:hypothetical protein